MSELKLQLEVFPPQKNRDGVISKETHYSTAHRCPCCNGEGWMWGVDETTNESVKLGCKACDGSGMVAPVISIDWLPLRMVASKSN